MSVVNELHLFNKEITLHTDPGNSKDETVAAIVEGNGINETVVLRVNMNNQSKSIEKYVRQFKCLNPNGNSRLYLIPEETVRRNVEGETPKRTKKKSQ